MIPRSPYNLQFTMTYAICEISFLDVSSFKDENNVLGIKLFTKPTEGKTIQHEESSDPAYLIQGIPMGQ